MALIDLDYFRRQPLGTAITKNVNDETLQEYIDEASVYVEDYLDRKMGENSYTERIVGTGRYTLILDNYPITDLVDVSYDGLAGDIGTHSTGDFLVHAESGVIEFINKMNYFRTSRVYVVQYTAGYDPIPGPVKRAVALQTVQLLRPMYGGPQTELPELVPFADELIINLLEKYRRKRLS